MKHFLPKFFAIVMELKFRIVYLLRGKVVGARALVVKGDQVLLVSHTYNNGWFTVGGLVERSESPLEAIKRELREEAGIHVTEDPQFIQVYHTLYNGKDDYVFFYWVKAFHEEKFSCYEIEEAKWFPIHNLPSEITPATKRRIEEYLGLREIELQW